MNEEWVTMKEAAERLGVGRNKISRLASRGIIKTKDNPLDARVRLVNLNELRTLFETYGSRIGDDKEDDEE
jgi:Helix-turn-helix domain